METARYHYLYGDSQYYNLYGDSQICKLKADKTNNTNFKFWNLICNYDEFVYMSSPSANNDIIMTYIHR